MRADVDIVDDVLMAVLAVALQGDDIRLADLYRLVKLLGGEFQRVPEAVFAFAQVLQQEAVRDMAVVAGCPVVMRRLHPSVVLFVHDVALDTRLRVVRQIGVPLGIVESVQPQTDKRTDEDEWQPFQKCFKHKRQRPDDYLGTGISGSTAVSGGHKFYPTSEGGHESHPAAEGGATIFSAVLPLSINFPKFSPLVVFYLWPTFDRIPKNVVSFFSHFSLIANYPVKIFPLPNSSTMRSVTLNFMG